MKLAALLLFAIAGLAAGQEVRPRVMVPGLPAAGGIATPWLGLTVGDLDEAIRAQVPDLPQGIGFVVSTVEPGGPAEKAGIKPYDLLWKMGDQWIVNKAQFLTLLRLRKEGEEVKLGIYRSGKALEIAVTLGRIPEQLLQAKPVVADSAQPKKPMPDMPMKVLTQSTAEIEQPDGKAILTRSGGALEVMIVSTSGSEIYHGPVTDEKGVALVPEPWRVRVGALERSLSHVIQGNASPRPPRQRMAVAE
ncbi:S1C family serine protease [Luteolibacter sp. Populi]|uniref:S1C family serine protease n=1 Tax=Luteolibacter sp. Populi TaxID=3230487 RepID=UPI00346655F0